MYEEGASDNGGMDQTKDVSTKEKEASEVDAVIDKLFERPIDSDGNDTDTSFDIVESENAVKYNFLMLYLV